MLFLAMIVFGLKKVNGSIFNIFQHSDLMQSVQQVVRKYQNKKLYKYLSQNFVLFVMSVAVATTFIC